MLQSSALSQLRAILIYQYATNYISPNFEANITASIELLTPNFPKTLCRYVFTVCRLMESLSEISLLNKPSLTNFSTSVSLLVRAIVIFSFCSINGINFPVLKFNNSDTVYSSKFF
jgi:hypothetical protein